MNKFETVYQIDPSREKIEKIEKDFSIEVSFKPLEATITSGNHYEKDQSKSLKETVKKNNLRSNKSTISKI